MSGWHTGGCTMPSTGNSGGMSDRHRTSPRSTPWSTSRSPRRVRREFPMWRPFTAAWMRAFSSWRLRGRAAVAASAVACLAVGLAGCAASHPRGPAPRPARVFVAGPAGRRRGRLSRGRGSGLAGRWRRTSRPRPALPGHPRARSSCTWWTRGEAGTGCSPGRPGTRRRTASWWTGPATPGACYAADASP